MVKETRKPKLIIVEGSQGTGKTTTTNYLREQMLNTNLLRLSGMKHKGDDANVFSFWYHYNVLDMILRNTFTEMSWVLDRSFISDYVYAQIGYKDYPFEEEFKRLSHGLNILSTEYDVYVIILTASEDVFKTRLCRDKAAYEEFSVESSIKQQKEYLKAIDLLDSNITKIKINTDNLLPGEVGELILKEIS